MYLLINDKSYDCSTHANKKTDIRIIFSSFTSKHIVEAYTEIRKISNYEKISEDELILSDSRLIKRLFKK